jgi:AcrR family transcriptional regulator
MDTARKPTKHPKLSEKPKPDRRIAKTQASLAQALFFLMQKRDWEDIAIQEICDVADVARSSFYAHFDDKIALLDQTIAHSLSHSREARKQQTGPLGLLAWIIDHVTENRPLFNRVARGRGDHVILSRFKVALCAELAAEFQQIGVAKPEIKAHFLLGGTFDALIAWSKTWKANQLPTVKAEVLAMATCIAEKAARTRL